MTQEDKDLLIKDLCARLPYGVKLQIEGTQTPTTFRAYNNHLGVMLDAIKAFPIDMCKPYLFPLSSMTEEQRNELMAIANDEYDTGVFLANVCGEYSPTYRQVDWLNEHHFDFRNLISRGLAIDATDLNIY